MGIAKPTEAIDALTELAAVAFDTDGSGGVSEATLQYWRDHGPEQWAVVRDVLKQAGRLNADGTVNFKAVGEPVAAVRTLDEKLRAECTERVLRAAGEVCNGLGDPAVNATVHKDLRELIDTLETAVLEYDSQFVLHASVAAREAASMTPVGQDVYEAQLIYDLGYGLWRAHFDEADVEGEGLDEVMVIEADPRLQALDTTRVYTADVEVIDGTVFLDSDPVLAPEGEPVSVDFGRDEQGRKTLAGMPIFGSEDIGSFIGDDDEDDDDWENDAFDERAEADAVERILEGNDED